MGMPGQVGLETYVFEEHDGTMLTTTSFFNTVEERDGVLEVGHGGGRRRELDRLDELLNESSSRVPPTTPHSDGQSIVVRLQALRFELREDRDQLAVGRSAIVPPSCHTPSRCWNGSGGSPWFIWMS